MGTIADFITEMNAAKIDIRAALSEIGIDTAGTPFDQWGPLLQKRYTGGYGAVTERVGLSYAGNQAGISEGNVYALLLSRIVSIVSARDLIKKAVSDYGFDANGGIGTYPSLIRQIEREDYPPSDAYNYWKFLDNVAETVTNAEYSEVDFCPLAISEGGIYVGANSSESLGLAFPFMSSISISENIDYAKAESIDNLDFRSNVQSTPEFSENSNFERAEGLDSADLERTDRVKADFSENGEYTQKETDDTAGFYAAPSAPLDVSENENYTRKETADGGVISFD
ncbi:hypothetical protein AGMMS49975_14100 [Clostridia bacterium]|nr:hypothetical protein AGMMS49975_14100 [Clostridia bacterium]